MFFFLLGLDLVLSSLSFGFCLVVNWLVIHWLVFSWLVLDFMLNFVFNFMLCGLSNCLVLGWLDWNRLGFGVFLLNRLCFNWLGLSSLLNWFDFWLVYSCLVLNWFMLDSLVLNRLVLNSLMFNFLVLNSWFYLNWLMLGRLMFLFLSNGLESWCFMFKDLLMLSSPLFRSRFHIRLEVMLDLSSFFCRLHFFLILSFLLSLFGFLLLSLSRFSGILLIRLFELFGDISNCRPIFRVLLLLPSHLDEEASGEYFLIKGVPNEIDGIDFGLEDDFKGPRVVFFDLDEFEIWEGLFNIFLYRVEVAFDDIEGYVLDLVREILNLLDQLLLLRHHKLSLLFLCTLHHTHKQYGIIIIASIIFIQLYYCRIGILQGMGSWQMRGWGWNFGVGIFFEVICLLLFDKNQL